MKVITVSNRKGGVGKTTMSTHLASGLTMLGYRVALVDTDSQGHCATAFDMPKSNGLYNLMTDDEATFADNIYQVPADNFKPDAWEQPEHPLYLIPSDKRTAEIASKQSSAFRFRRMLKEMRDLLELDFVIIDTSPTNTMFDGSIMLATDYLLYVTQLNGLSFDGLQSAVGELKQVNRDIKEFRDTPVEILGVIPNLMRAGTRNHRENIADLVNDFPAPIFTLIPQRTIWETAFEYGVMVYRYAPYMSEFQSAWHMVEQCLKGLGEIPQTENLLQSIMETRQHDPA
jgi:chromosome partitioning protein